MKYIVSLDQGTTSSRAVLFDETGKIVGIKQKEFPQYFPKPGWVEHDPDEIWASQVKVFKKLLKQYSLSPSDISAIGITNQRETTLLWDKKTGEPIHNALVWQDKRTAAICKKLKKQGLEAYIKENTGLVIDSYFSASKVIWLLENVPGARERAENGELLFGTIDTWLVWKASKGKCHVTDYTNASRTMLFNIKTLEWDKHLLKEMNIPEALLPEALPSAAEFCQLEFEGSTVPILGIAGDQQAALFGQVCFEPGMAKNTYGTGCFMLMNTGTTPRISENGLLTTIAWGLDGKVEYALEGSIFVAGAAVQWLRDGIKIIDTAPDSEYYAEKAGTNDEVFVVPAFAGLGAPYWDMYARGAIFGLTRDTGREQIVRATLQSLAYQTRDVLEAMENDSQLKLQALKVDGGASSNNFLMQFQADMLGVNVERPKEIESTAMGAAFLAGIKAGVWKKEQLPEILKVGKSFEPKMPVKKKEKLYQTWKKAVKRSMGWVGE
ncbi:glycerol kinase GlpK [Flammeovirgaceae bacterium SG7u.111]|nr:glycerol kinase GlpK [Flammeovirgaceae bacterium SG7u.132]WPO37694.1 glycerol kinase GlpK [Flammeovirgaceae bacterium SG7u.111]